MGHATNQALGLLEAHDICRLLSAQCGGTFIVNDTGKSYIIPHEE